MLFSEFAKYLQQLESISSRLDITAILAQLFQNLSADEIQAGVNLSLGQLKPKYEKLEFNLADKMVVRALASNLAMDIKEVESLVRTKGDIGLAGYELKFDQQNNKPSQEISNLTLMEIYSDLCELASDSGQGSQDRKLSKLNQIFSKLDPLSTKMVIRIILSKLRLGFSDMTILDSLSWMVSNDKSHRPRLEDSFQLLPDIGLISELVKKYGIEQFDEHIELQVGRPVIPALAQRLKTAQEMIDKMGEVSVDPKYDGTRVQIHYKRHQTNDNVIQPNTLFSDSSMIKTFTRNLDESSEMFPELNQLGDYINADEVILDCEAVGYDPKTDQLLPFQMTIQRKRKHGVAELAAQIPLRFFLFDILYKDGKSLLSLPLEQRYQILKDTVVDGPFTQKTELIVTSDPDQVRSFHAHCLAEGLEGAMVKKWQGVYQPGRKGWSWVKFKEVEGSAAKLSDTVDAVVMGLYAGEGKRTKFGVGAFLIGIRAATPSSSNNSTFIEGNFYTISKVGTGLTDEQWVELASRCKPLENPNPPVSYVVDKNLVPDVWINPGLVVEVAADEVTNSPIHTAKLALRFPRLIKFRDDKSVDQVTSLSELDQIK